MYCMACNSDGTPARIVCRSGNQSGRAATVSGPRQLHRPAEFGGDSSVSGWAPAAAALLARNYGCRCRALNSGALTPVFRF